MRPRFFFPILAAAGLAVNLPAQTPSTASIAYAVQQGSSFAPLAVGATISFPDTALGRTSTLTLKATNASQSGTATISDAATLGTAFQLEALNFFPLTLQPGQSTTFLIDFTPTQAGPVNGRIRIGTDVFTLGGNGLAATLSYMYAVNGAASAPISPSGTITFPDTPLGHTTSITIQAFNNSAVSVAISDAAILGAAFQLENLNFFPMTLRAGQSASFIVDFAPTQAGAAIGRLRIGADVFNLGGNALGPVLSYTYAFSGSVNVSALVPTQQIVFPDTQTGSKTLASITVKNGGGADATISDMAVQGAAFQIVDPPFFPLTVPAGSSAVLEVAFVPTDAAALIGYLRIGKDVFNLAGNGLAAKLVYSYVSAGVVIPLATSNTVAFPSTNLGGASNVVLTIQNTGNQPATIGSIGTDGDGRTFRVLNLPALPLQIAPGTSAALTLAFSPSATGASTANLHVDGASFLLTGTGTTPPPFPSYTLSGASGAVDTLAQPGIALTLAAPYSLNVSGTLTITFASDVFSDDPSIQFASGGRTVAFTIPANSTKAVFPNGANLIRMQTGSVAGTILIAPTFTTDTGVALQASSAPLKLTVPSAAPKLLAVSMGGSSNTGFTLTVSGLASGRNLQQIGLHFTPAAGVTIKGLDTTIDVSQAFTTWFQSAASQANGGLFTATVPFTVTGLSATSTVSSLISAVAVTLTNAQGSSGSATVQTQGVKSAAAVGASVGGGSRAATTAPPPGNDARAKGMNP